MPLWKYRDGQTTLNLKTNYNFSITQSLDLRFKIRALYLPKQDSKFSCTDRVLIMENTSVKTLAARKKSFKKVQSETSATKHRTAIIYRLENS